MKFTKDKALKVGWVGLDGWVYSSNEDFSNASGVYFEVTGSHGKIKTTTSDRVYFVKEGSGEFEIDGEAISVEENDMIIVPKNTPYDYRTRGGVLKLFLIHTPAFNPAGEVVLEKKKGREV